jgi:hypothetical protein
MVFALTGEGYKGVDLFWDLVLADHRPKYADQLGSQNGSTHRTFLIRCLLGYDLPILKITQLTIPQYAPQSYRPDAR